jgi:hypothetical protein
VRGDLELCAVLCMAGPLASELEGFAALHPRQGADDGYAILGGLGRLGPQFGDRVVVLLVEEDDALEDAGEGDGGRSSHKATRLHRQARRRNHGDAAGGHLWGVTWKLQFCHREVREARRGDPVARRLAPVLVGVLDCFVVSLLAMTCGGNFFG